MNRHLRDFHLTRLSGQKEIDVVGLTVGRLHVHTREVFPTAKIGEPIVTNSYQIESQILTLVLHMKLAVAALFGLQIISLENI